MGVKRNIKDGCAQKVHTHKEVNSILQSGIVERLCRSAFSLPFNGLLILVLFQFSDKVPYNLYLLSAVAAELVRRMDFVEMRI